MEIQYTMRYFTMFTQWPNRVFSARVHFLIRRFFTNLCFKTYKIMLQKCIWVYYCLSYIYKKIIIIKFQSQILIRQKLPPPKCLPLLNIPRQDSLKKKNELCTTVTWSTNSLSWSTTKSQKNNLFVFKCTLIGPFLF